MQRRVGDRWGSIALSVLLHAALLSALVYGWLLYRRPPRPAPTLAIEATVVDARAVRGKEEAAPPPAPPAAPQPEPQEPLGPPQPTPEELAQREQEHQQEEAEAAQREREEQAAAAAARETEARAARERKHATQLAAAAAAKRAADERQRQQEDSERAADLQRSLAAEEKASAARSGPALASWESEIAAKITRAWLRPPTARPGIECMLYVTQVPGGEVTQVRIGACNGDQAVRESIEAAVYRASPLPPPPDPALFDRNLRINFKPD
jgi:colicin import membrane protein